MNTNDPSELVAIDRTGVFRNVLKQLETFIDTRNLQPGDRLPSDRELAAALEVSRPVVRQAIKVLEGLGRLTSIQGSGTYVTDSMRELARQLVRTLPINPQLVQQSMEARRAIELEVLRSAFNHRATANLTILEEALTPVQQSSSRAEEPGPSTLDLSFEQALGRICGNEVLRRLQSLTQEAWLETQLTLGLAPHSNETMHTQHRAIFEHFKNGQLDAASKLFSEHLSFGAPDSSAGSSGL